MIEQAIALVVFSTVMLAMLTVTVIAEKCLTEKWWTRLVRPLKGGKAKCKF
ncbi:MAG: hypothetical protein KH334_01700 [Clostridiales bacterium]|nr:hypothetical protein [Clostridiales bacterium]